jgi:hypothetical protein
VIDPQIRPQRQNQAEPEAAAKVGLRKSFRNAAATVLPRAVNDRATRSLNLARANETESAAQTVSRPSHSDGPGAG